uniref:Uncharacterized protein n=1 Tax=Octopus bimaculoides TaxID=37653 RepID=A0A0L8FPM9_OCTBM
MHKVRFTHTQDFNMDETTFSGGNADRKTKPILENPRVFKGFVNADLTLAIQQNGPRQRRIQLYFCSIGMTHLVNSQIRG